MFYKINLCYVEHKIFDNIQWESIQYRLYCHFIVNVLRL